MRTSTRFLGLLAASALTLTVAVPVLAAGPTVYQGVFSGAVTYEGCTTTPPESDATGTWAIVDRGDTATLQVAIKTNGKHHVAFAGTFATDTAGGESIAVLIPTQASEIPLRVSVVGDDLVYAIEDYDIFGMQCELVTYHGLVLRTVP